MSEKRYIWAAPGDVNAFFGLMLDNIAGLLLLVSLMATVFQFPANFAIRYMVPGTAIGVLVGDLIFFFMAFQLAKRTGSNSVTAMPLGLDTPSTFGMVFLVLGPAFIKAKAAFAVPEGATLADESLLLAASYTWQIGICAIVVSGVFKFACAIGSGWIRRVLPRAGLLGSLTAIALVLISFLPLMEILHFPVVGLLALSIILTTLVARIPFPGRVPGALAALLLGGGLYYLMYVLDCLPHVTAEAVDPRAGLLPYEWMTVFRFEWVGVFRDSLHYLPIVIPFALATVVGGIDCTESAAAAGDEYDTRSVIAVEAFATLVAGLCGGVIQTTPYIGHPAYKAMGGRAAYTLATALFVGAAGVFGFFGYMYAIIPRPTVYPILIFIGLEISAQSFYATPRRHYPAVALACAPALAMLVNIFAGNLLGEFAAHGVTADALSTKTQGELFVVKLLAGGFIVTSLLWASTLAAIIDRRLPRAALLLFITAACALFGIIHSPLDGGAMFWPWDLWQTSEGETASFAYAQHVRETPLRFAAGYALSALLLLAWHGWLTRYNPTRPLDGDDELPEA